MRGWVVGSVGLALFVGLAAAAWWWLWVGAAHHKVVPSASPYQARHDERIAIHVASRSDPAPSAAPAGPTPAPTPLQPSACPLTAIPTPYTSPHWPVPADWLVGADGFETLEREQPRNHAPALVYFYTDWCPHCRRLDRELLQSNEVDRALRDGFVRVRLNPELGSAEREIAQRFGVTGYPSLFVIVAGENLGRLSPYGSSEEGTRLLTGEDFLRTLETRVATWADGRFGQAHSALGRRDLSAALAVLDALVEVRPNELRAYLLRARTRADSGDLPGAIEDLRRVLDAAPDEPTAYSALHDILGRTGRWDEIIACWSLLLERIPYNGPARLARGAAYSQKDDRERALADLREACRLREAEACEAVRRFGG